MNSSSGDPMMQLQQPMGGDPSISGRPPDMSSNNPQLLQLQPPPNTTLSMAPFPGLGGDQQMGGQGAGGGGSIPPPPPRCQMVNPFLGTPPLVPNVDRMQQQATGMAGGSSLNQMEGTFSQDMRHRGYPGILNLPPPFQVHPNLQSQIQAFQHDIGQHGGHMPQQPPGGFLQAFIPTEIVSTVPDSRSSSHLLQRHVRQRARRRSRANRSASIQHVHEAPPALVGASGGGGGGDATSAVALGRSREMPPAAQITVDAGFGDNGAAAAAAAAAAAVVAAAGAAAMLEDAKLKGLEENYTSIGENFECNICFQKANEAVVTCCGHLFCWPCLYRWLHIHSYHKECPVCKGAIDESTITPIYGRECNALLSARGLAGGSAAERIPPRPPARRVESTRQLREREDRGREREQRERALERERERERELQQSSESRGLAEVLVGQPPGVVTASSASAAAAPSIEEGGVMRDSSGSAISSVQGQIGGGGGGGGGGAITVSTSTGRQQEEIDSRASAGHQDTSSSGESMSQPIGPPGVNAAASSFPSPGTGGRVGGGGAGGHPLPGAGGGGGSNASSTASFNTSVGGAPAFLQRRVSDRREQLRAALAASARSGSGANSISSTLSDRLDERRQMIAAAALLSQEWEDIVNISRLVGPANPVQAAAWRAAVQGRLGSSTAGTTSVESLGDFPSHPHHYQPQQHSVGGGGGGGVLLSSQPVHRSNASSRHMIYPPGILPQDGGSAAGGDDSSTLSRLVTFNPLQAGNLLAAMRSRLTSMEKIVETLDSPLQVLQQPPASLSLNLPSAHSSVSQGGQLLQTSSGTSAAPDQLEELSLLDTAHPMSASNSTTTSMEGPSSRAVQERAAAAAASEAPPASAPPASSSSTASASAPVQSNARTQAEPRLHYRESPVPKPPSSSRRRSSRTGEEGTTSMMTNSNNNNNQNPGQGASVGGQHDATTEGSGCTGSPPEPMSSSRSKRRRLD